MSQWIYVYFSQRRKNCDENSKLYVYNSRGYFLEIEKSERGRIMKIRCIFAVCLVLSAAGASSAKPEETRYYGVFMDGKKIGHAIRSRVMAEGKVTTTREVSIQVNRDGVPTKVVTTETSIETPDGKPLGFKVVQNAGGAAVGISGTVDAQWIIDATATSMGREQKKAVGWPSGALMDEGLHLLQLEKGLKDGLEYGAKIFNPSSLQAIEVKIHIGSKQNVDLLGRAAALTEVKTIIETPEGSQIANTEYVDDDLSMQKSVMPMMGTQQMELIACTREVALGENKEVDLIDKMFLASPEPLNNIESAKSVVYYLEPNSQSMKLAIPSSDNQSVEKSKEDVVVVTVRPIAAPAGVKFPYEGRDSNALEAMKPTRFVQSDYNEIIELAKRAVGETKDSAEAVKKIESFVSGYVKNRSLSVGYATAAEVAASKVGDCTEFAVLTASMCRAIGIPARVVSGLVYAKSFGGRENVFGGHMWVEAYVGDKWIGLDATKAPKGFDAGHIALAIGNGEPTDFLNLAATLGQFKINKVTIETGKAENKP